LVVEKLSISIQNRLCLSSDTAGEVRLPSVLGRLGAESFELSLWTTFTTTRRVAVFAGPRF
jgi:hypothetical protein